MIAAFDEASASLQHYLDERRIDDSLRVDLLSLAPPEQEVAVSIVTSLKPSANTLRDIFRLASEVCRRDSVLWSELFSEPAAAELLAADCRLGPKDRQKELKRFLERKRFPETSAIEAELERCRKELTRKSGVAVTYPADLEGDELSVTVRFSSPEELASSAEKLKKAAGDPALEKIFQLLKGEA